MKIIKKFIKFIFYAVLSVLIIYFIGGIITLVHMFLTCPRLDDDPVYKANMAYRKQAAEAKILTEQIAREVSLTYDLNFLMRGRIGELGKCSDIISFVFYCNQTLNIDEAKILARNVTNTYIAAIQNCPEIIKAFEIRPVHVLDKMKPMFEPKYLSFRISFWDSQDNRQRTPYIAEIRLDDGVFSYYTTKTSKTDEIELLCEEPL